MEQNYAWAVFAAGTNESTLYSFVLTLSLSFIYTFSHNGKLIVLQISNTWVVIIKDSIDSITPNTKRTIVKVMVYYRDDINSSLPIEITSY